MMRRRWVTIFGGILRALAVLAVVAVLARLGWMLCEEKVRLVRPLQFIGHADEAAYVAMGESLAEGRGLNVRYISWFFEAYPAEVTHREDHWPPFMGLAIAPCFVMLGKAAWVAKLPGIFFGSVGLPLTTGLLAYALSRRGYVAIGAGLLMMAHPVMFTESLKTLSDVATAMLLAGFCWGLVAAWKRPWMHLVAGFFAACAYYAKGSELILLGLYPLLAVLIEGPRVFTRRWMYLGMLTAGLLMAPYWYSNWQVYGSPLHSTQNYVSGYMGLADWETATYAPYWGGRGMELPRTSDRWTKYANHYQQEVADNRVEAGRLMLSGGYNEGFVWDDFGGWGVWAREWLAGRDPRALLRGNRLVVERRKRELAAPVQPIGQWHALPWELAAVGSAGLVGLAVVLLLPLMLWEVVRWMWRKVAGWRKRRRGAAVAGSAGCGKESGNVIGKTCPAGPLPHWAWHPKRRSRKTCRARLAAADGAAVAAPSAWSPGRLEHFCGAVVALGVVLGVHAGFLVYLWEVQPRFCFIFLPILAALGCTAFSIVIDWPVAVAGKLAAALWRRSGRGLAGLKVCGLLGEWQVVPTLVLAVWLWSHAPQLKSDYLVWQARRHEAGYPYQDQLRYVEAGRWIGAHLPGAVVMTRNPWELLFYCAPSNKAVNIPLVASESESPTVIFSIARYYRVTHIYFDVERPGMWSYISGRRPGLRRVAGGPDGLYEIVDYQLLPVGEMDALFPAGAGGGPAGGAQVQFGHAIGRDALGSEVDRGEVALEGLRTGGGGGGGGGEGADDVELPVGAGGGRGDEGYGEGLEGDGEYEGPGGSALELAGADVGRQAGDRYVGDFAHGESEVGGAIIMGSGYGGGAVPGGGGLTGPIDGDFDEFFAGGGGIEEDGELVLKWRGIVADGGDIEVGGVVEDGGAGGSGGAGGIGGGGEGGPIGMEPLGIGEGIGLEGAGGGAAGHDDRGWRGGAVSTAGGRGGVAFAAREERSTGGGQRGDRGGKEDSAIVFAHKGCQPNAFDRQNTGLTGRILWNAKKFAMPTIAGWGSRHAGKAGVGGIAR